MSGISRSRFFGDQPYEGVGSGVIYSSDGYIITNEHVVSQGDHLADSVEVTFSTGETVPATIVATDSYTDIAVLKVDKTGLSAATFADDASVTVGEYAIAIGSPLDYSNSVTLGIVSGLGRSIENSGSTALVDLIQTDAAISPGNSGGALLDSDGRVIGINVAYMPANMTGAENIGFAIPADTAVAVAQQLISKGSASHAYMGINYVSMTTSLQRQYRLAVDTGVLVTAVAPQSPAGQAGLQAGDIITAMDGREVAVDTDLIMVLRAHQAGDSITVTVDRNGQTIDLTVNLGNRSDSTTSTTMPRASTQM
jgi:S1-C subfamily serine protease